MPLSPGQRPGKRLGQWAALALAAAITMVPWFNGNYVYPEIHVFRPAVAADCGGARGRAAGPGAATTISRTSRRSPDRTELDARVREVAAAEGIAPEGMLDYVHEWQEIRKIWESPTDPMERARARVVADQEYLRAALEHIRADRGGWIRRHSIRSPLILWVSDIPIRYTDIKDLPVIVIRLIWLAQAVLLAIAVAGLLVLVRRRRYSEAALLALPLLYVTGVHIPLLVETRQSLPVKPLVILLAAIAITSVTSPRSEAS